MKSELTSSEEIQVLNTYLNSNVETKQVIRAVSSSIVTILKFSAGWCGPCKKLSAELDKDMERSPGVYLGVSIFEINVDDECCEELTRKYEVTSIPLCIVIPSPISSNVINGKETRIVGCKLQQIKDAILNCQSCSEADF